MVDGRASVNSLSHWNQKRFPFSTVNSQKRCLWTHKEVSLAPHPVVGLVLQTGDEEFSQAFGLESLDIFLGVSTSGPYLTTIEADGDDTVQYCAVNAKSAFQGWGCSPVGRASYRHAADAGSIPLCGKGFFSQSQLSVRLFYGVSTPPCAIACFYICAHVKDPVVHVRVRWIVETLKHPACTVG